VRSATSSTRSDCSRRWRTEGSISTSGTPPADDARHIVGALDAIGARRIADITRRAVALFGDEGPSGDRRKRWKQMDRDRDYKELVWNELDVEFYECEEPLEQALVAYARSHAAEFAE
jgi:hypothetical protein